MKAAGKGMRGEHTPGAARLGARLEVEREPVPAAAEDAGHRRLAGQAFLEAEDGIAVLRHAVKNPDLAGAAGSFATGGQKAGAGAVDGVQDGVVRGVLPAGASSGALQRRE